MIRPAPCSSDRRVAIIGSCGIPNRYGGFESFAEAVTPVLVNMGYDVTVTGDASRHQDDLSAEFLGARRVFLGLRANGVLSPIHDLFAFLRVVRHSDFILVLGVSGGPFFPLFRLLCDLFRCKLLVNIDGVEWRRTKFSLFGRSVLYIFDLVAQRFAHTVIYDNEALGDYVRYRGKSVCVEYSGDQAAEPPPGDGLPSVPPRVPYALTICRIEPENNCEMLIEGFLASSFERYVFVGNWDSSPYGRELRQKYAHEERLRMIDPVYDRRRIFELRAGCSAYLHGHSVGGTNPSLVEMLFFGCDIFCYDCPYNRYTAKDGAQYFACSADLGAKIDAPSPSTAQRRESLRGIYSSDAIVSKLVAAFVR